jgi:hypothetical protein
MSINDILVNQLVSEYKEARYRECNYYMADTLIAKTSLEWVIKVLQSRLAKCLNADKGYCDIWYLESHSNCKLLMDILYEFTEDPIYSDKPKMYVNDTLWD